MLTVITKSLKKKEKVLWSASAPSRSPGAGREGRNPQTGEKIKIPRQRPALQGSKQIKDAIN